MICFFDNDIIYKLASCDLLDDSLATFDLAQADIYVLPTAKYKFGIAKKRSVKGVRTFGTEVFGRIRNFISSVNEIDIPAGPRELELLAEIDGIDAGEAVLFSVTAQFDQYLLATGDKTSLRALSEALVCRPIAIRLQGHVVCFEQFIERVIKHCGFPYVKKKVLPARGCDTALRAAFGSGRDATEANVHAALEGYVNELRSLPIDLLA